MGCYPPLVKFVSRAIRKCNGRERWREERLDYATAYPPGRPMETHYMRPVARTVAFASNDDVYVIPPQKTPPPQQQQEQKQKQSTPEPSQQPQTPPIHEPDHHDTAPQPQLQPEPPAPEQEEAPDPAPPAEPKPPKAPKRGKNKKPGGRVRFGPEPPPPQQQQHAQDPGNAPGHHDGQHGHRHGPQAGPVPAYPLRYTPSPLPRWEATPRRHEYFSGEYRSYYPTPVREGIYRIATDANRLTTIFSEENPNACTIV